MSVSGQKRIFIVEDNFMYSYLLEVTLKEYGNFKVTTFTSGEECIKLLHNNPDLIILDYSLEGEMTGLDTLKTIHSKNSKIPVIVLSSQPDPGVAVDLLKLGAFDYIEKKDKEAAMNKLHSTILKVFK